jgi:hypothetical protein
MTSPNLSFGNQATFFILYLHKGVKPPLETGFLSEWRKEIKETPTSLSWFLDLSIKLWLHRIG